MNHAPTGPQTATSMTEVRSANRAPPPLCLANRFQVAWISAAATTRPTARTGMGPCSAAALSRHDEQVRAQARRERGPERVDVGVVERHAAERPVRGRASAVEQDEP